MLVELTSARVYSTHARNYSAGVPRGLQGPLAGCAGLRPQVSPPSSPTLPPEAVLEKET